MHKNLLLLSLIVLFLGCKKDEKQYNIRLVVDGGKYVSSIYRLALDKRIPIAVDSTSRHTDVTVHAQTADDLFLIRITNLGDEPVNLKTFTIGDLRDSKTLDKGDMTYHQYYFSSDSPSEETIEKLGNDYQRQYIEDNEEHF